MYRHDTKYRSRTFHSKAVFGLIMAVLVVFLTATALGQPKKDSPGQGGWLYVNQFFSPKQMTEIPGFVPSKVWIYDEKGHLVDSKQGSGQFPTGMLIPLPEGWYVIEIGHEHVHGNAWKYYVQAGKVTIAQTGFVKVTSMSPDSQKPDMCTPWNATMKIFIKDGGKIEFLATNKESSPKEIGLIQLHVGMYVVEFNGLQKEIEIKENQIYEVPLGYFGPYRRSEDFLSMEQRLETGVPFVRLCKDHPTQVISGKYWEYYEEPINEYPFKEKKWKEVEIGISGAQGYTKIKPYDKVKNVFKGNGSIPEKTSIKQILEKENAIEIKPMVPEDQKNIEEKSTTQPIQPDEKDIENNPTNPPDEKKDIENNPTSLPEDYL